MSRSQISTQIREIASRLGFDQVGFARAERMDPEAERLEQWLNKGYHGKMSYMENHFEKRVDPTLLVPGAKSVISLVFNYFPEQLQHDPEAPKIARYAYGEDYHKVLKDKLFTMLDEMRAKWGDIQGRCFVDSAPVMERDWAKRSGLGWIGRNTLLIHPKRGSYYFLTELIVDLELEYDHPIKDYCGTCTKCVEACPTDAFVGEGYLLDASKCISYLTIELKEAIPQEFSGKMENWAFGCDICQEVCPWNRFSTPHKESAFQPVEPLLDLSKEEWQEITEEVFNPLFKKSAVQRTGYEGLKRNLRFIAESEEGEL
jgi:epoxyqueuosine reductase